MTIKAILLGINRFLAPTISELGGARRDCTSALWALFTGTIEGLEECIGVGGSSLLRPKPGIKGAAL